MRLPSHVLTTLTLAGAVGTVAAITTCDPAQRRECQPSTAIEKADATPLSEIVRTTQVPSFVVVPGPQVQPQPMPPRPQIKAKPKPARAFVSSCGHLVPADSKNVVLCGKG